MKKVYIVHGWDGSPDEPLFLWLDKNLTDKGYEVKRLSMPDPKVPVIEKWIGKLKEEITPDENTILVGHSVGCQAVMRYLETQDENLRIAGMLLLAPWMHLDQTTIEEEGEEVIEIARPWMETPINFEKLKMTSPKITAIFSDNDDFVPVSEEKFFADKLSAKTIMEHEKGHFSPAENIYELQSALDAILDF
jgi:predicted alpha/beta hydrolase family esterase